MQIYEKKTNDNGSWSNKKIRKEFSSLSEEPTLDGLERLLDKELD